MKHNTLLSILAVITATFTGCNAPTEGTNKAPMFERQYIDAHLSFDNLPGRDRSGNLMFRMVVLDQSGLGLMPGISERTPHLWLMAYHEPLQELINIDTTDTTWFTPMTVGDTLDEFDDELEQLSYTSIWYGPVALGDTVSFELDFAILDDVFCCGEQDTLYPYITGWTNEAGEHFWGNHAMTIAAVYMWDNLTRANLTYSFFARMPVTFVFFKYNHVSGQYAFRNPKGDSWTYGVNSLE